MPNASAITVTPDPRNALSFNVAVRDGKGESRHRVRISAADAARYSAGEPARIVEAAMAFLLDREPRESILPQFDIAVIRRYFPEFDEAFPAYLSRPSKEAHS